VLKLTVLYCNRFTPLSLPFQRIPQLVAYADQPLTWRNGKRVAITQTRRIAAIAAARRVADEMDGKSLFSLFFTNMII
jgi:hypothetical protein